MIFTANVVDKSRFNRTLSLPFELRLMDFESAMQDVYDFFFDVNSHLVGKGLERLDDMLRPAILSGVLSDIVTASLARHSRALTENRFFNGHPDLVVRGVYANNSVKAGRKRRRDKDHQERGVGRSIRMGRETSGCVFSCTQSTIETEPAIERQPLTFTEIYLGHVTIADFRRNRQG